MTRSVWRGCANSWARKLVRSKGEMKIPHAVRHTWTVQRRHPRRQRSDAVCYYTMAFKVPTDSATDQSTKLLVRARTSTLSVTGSIMVRNNQRAVQLGPCTKGFVPTNLAIFLDTGKYLSGTTSFSTKHGVLAAGSAWYHGAVAPNAFPGSIPFLLIMVRVVRHYGHIKKRASVTACRPAPLSQTFILTGHSQLGHWSW